MNSHAREQVELLRVLHEDAPLGERGDAARIRDGHRHNEGARARDDHERQGAMQPPHAPIRACARVHPTLRPSLGFLAVASLAVAARADVSADARHDARPIRSVVLSVVCPRAPAEWDGGEEYGGE